MAVYSVNSESLAAIADAIRAKTGLTDTMSLEQMALDVAAAPALPGDVPDYVRTEAERVADAVRALQNENTLTFIAFSDTHMGNGSYDVSVTHAMQAAQIIAGRVGADFVAHLGDHVTGAASDSLDTHLDNLTRALQAEAIVSPTLRLVGNHDANAYNAASYLSAEDTDKYIGRYSRGVTKPASEPERGYFYVDIEAKKTRVICLNTADLKGIAQANASDGHNVSGEQLKWLGNYALAMGGKEGWRVIVLSHHPIHWYGSMGNVLTVLDAYVAGESCTVTAGNSTTTLHFSGENDAELVATFHGHTHNLIHGLAGTAEIIRMGTPNGCFTRSNEYGSSSYGEDFRNKYGETTTYAKTANSAKDTAFCVYTIDFEARAVFATCYGAGYDRVMSYADAVYYSITNSLTNVTTSNAIGALEAGSSYSATLAPASGYSLGTVTVKMGGKDITASAYANGVITIAEVTGDVVITAAGVKESVNWAYKGIGTDGNIYNGGKGYKENTRISTSSGNESGASGMTVTGFIWVPNAATIRVKDIDLTNGNSTYGIYDSSFAKTGTGYCDTLFGAADANGVRSRVNTAGDAYYRIAGAWGSNPIITVNEEIK